ncbi:MAG: hypothetical protein LBK99_19630 [Opitutaceae bacterium]|jgi:hypothetical protein|nr:hypothetical protein [Opitutaceae bacterium]
MASNRTSNEDSPGFVSRIRFTGRGGGLVKALRGFDKSRHTVPDAVNGATLGFLARLCAAELSGEAESFFQRTRAALGYKRKDLALDVSSPLAVLSARDFTFEIGYDLVADSPSAYVVTRTLHSLRNGELVHLAAFDALFAAQFSALSFTLRKGVRVEAVIDAVESLDGVAAAVGRGSACATTEGAALRVDYPSDCGHCVLTVDGVEAEVVCEGASLEMRFPRAGSPAGLVTAFAAVRSAFSLTRNTALAGLL